MSNENEMSNENFNFNFATSSKKVMCLFYFRSLFKAEALESCFPG